MREAHDEFIESMGRHFDEEGVPRIAGRLFGLLMLTEEPASLDELADRLQVSKGSISSNARLLEDWGVAERVTHPGDRRDYYRLTPDMNVRLLERQLVRIRVMEERLRRARERLAPMSRAVADRMDGVTRFNDMALRSIERMLEEAREVAGRG